jgi:chromosome segregation ATPase
MAGPEQILIQHTKEISAVQESAKSAHKRLDENDRIITGIHKLAANMENLTIEVKRLAEKLENGLREQGKRIGAVEAAFMKVSAMESDVKTALSKIESIEREPADRWKSLKTQLISLVVAAVVGGTIAVILH